MRTPKTPTSPSLATPPKAPTLEKILTEHFELVRCTLWRKYGVPWRDLSDVEQEVWCAAVRRFESDLAGDPTISPVGWLLGLCEAQADRYYRTENGRRREVSYTTEALDIIEGGTPTLEEGIADAERCALLLKLVNGLNPSVREVVVAHELEGVAMADVAARLQIPVATAWNRRRCGLDNLYATARRKRGGGSGS